MATEDPKDDVVQPGTAEDDTVDPTSTDHPAGAEQAAENAAEDSPS